jgi:hypothetical protein
MKYLLIALTLLLAPANMHAELVTFGFTGGAHDLHDINAVGFTVTGEYTFDSVAIPIASSIGGDDVDFATYPGIALTLNYLGITKVINGITITVRDFLPPPPPLISSTGDKYFVRSIADFGFGYWFSLSMMSCSNPFTSTALPTTIDFSLFPTGMCGDLDDWPQFYFSIDGLHAGGGFSSIARIPEPWSLWLVIAGVCAALCFRYAGKGEALRSEDS